MLVIADGHPVSHVGHVQGDARDQRKWPAKPCTDAGTSLVLKSPALVCSQGSKHQR